MSEYQYYEFQAIDRPLTEKETDELRSYSTRARITPISFVNDYSWGSFKGNEDAWMDRYFDAFLYLANWGTHVLKVRLPSKLLDLKTARQYCAGERASAREKSGLVILSFSSEDEGGGDWVEGDGQLSSIISIRAELARGDLRALYLGWLLCAQEGDLEDEDIEPPVPPGLGQLSACLESMAEFLRIDADLLDVAAKASRPINDARPKHDEVLAWVAKLSATEKDDLLARWISGEDAALPAELSRRFLEERRGSHVSPTGTRTVGELRRAAEARTEERQRAADKKAAGEKARREREAIAARQKYLDALAPKAPQLWGQVESLIATKQPKSYERAIALLVDLRDLSARGDGFDFRSRIEALRTANVRKPALLERLGKAGL
jgi:hypothetical protein